jgi:hypothetical protein
VLWLQVWQYSLCLAEMEHVCQVASCCAARAAPGNGGGGAEHEVEEAARHDLYLSHAGSISPCLRVRCPFLSLALRTISFRMQRKRMPAAARSLLQALALWHLLCAILVQRP